MNVADVKTKATWELRSMVQALSNGVSAMFNTPEDEKVLKAAKAELARRDKRRK